LTVLDLSLPRRDGWRVLNQIERDEHLRSIPVIVISTAPVHLNKVRAVSSGEHAYLEKPYDLEDVVK
jgi:CheY-like chemotaxis protein